MPMPSLSARDVGGVMGNMPTPIKEIDMNRNTVDAVDLDESARAAISLVDGGITSMGLNGTLGEVPSLTWEEIKAFTGAVIDAIGHRVPVFAGATTLNTRDTIARGKVFRDMGAAGLNLGRPMMSPLSDENIIQFYRDVAEELPDMAIFLYDDMEAFKRPLTTSVYAELAKIPQIVACKYRTRLLLCNVTDNSYNADLDAVGDNIKLMPMEIDWLYAYRLFGVDACWSSAVSAGPAPIMALQNALFSEQWEEAEAITKDLTWTYEGMIPNRDFNLWHVDKIPFMKARFQASGFMKAGPSLPPYHYISPERRKVAEEMGRRAGVLQQKYAARQAVSGIAAE